ncbi:hypothetical protein pb186bvf_016645 [Paramecium bursaria]
MIYSYFVKIQNRRNIKKGIKNTLICCCRRIQIYMDILTQYILILLTQKIFNIVYNINYIAKEQSSQKYQKVLVQQYWLIQLFHIGQKQRDSHLKQYWMDGRPL